MSTGFEIQMVSSLTAVSCSILGVFLVLKKTAMLCDAISHTVLLGIVLTFFLTRNINSPLLIIGAGITGVLTVYFIELLNSTKLLKEDSSTGIVFSFLFSIAVILISKYAKNIHLDIDAVLLGEIAFIPFNRTEILGISIPESLIKILVIFCINLFFIVIFFKELKISVFDRNLASVLGIKPVLIHYMLISAVSVTSVSSFEAVGSILVTAFMIGPPVTAYLLTDNLKEMIIFSILIGIISSIAGYHVAVMYDISIAGTVSVIIGILFFSVLIFSPKKGLAATLKKRIKK